MTNTRTITNLAVLAPLALLALYTSSTSADQNGYAARYECRAGAPHCNVDVAALGTRACDQIITTSMPWSTINWSNNTICLEAGDHAGKGTLTIPSNANGNAGNYKVLRYYRSGDNGDEPWNQSAQAKIWQLRVSGDYWLVHRLTFPGVSGTSPSPRIETAGGGGGDVRNVIFNRLLVEGSGRGSNYYGISQACGAGSYDWITVQNSLFRNVGPYAQIYEAIAVDMQCSNNMHTVNNEIYDWVSHPIQIGQNGISTLAGIVVENNDLYISPALHTNGGAKAIAESPLSIKAKGTSSSPIRIIHNRIWGARLTDLTQCCNGEAGNAITMYDSNDYVQLLNNIITDSQIGVSNVADRNSYVGNLFYNIKQFNSGTGSLVFDSWYSHDGASSYEVYLNTIIGASHYTLGAFDQPNVDVRCNAMLASGAKYPSSPAGSSQADYNAFYGAPAWTFNASNSNIVHSLMTRADGANYSAGDVIRLGSHESCSSMSDARCFLYKVLTGGATANGAPSYCTSLGCIMTDGNVTLQAVRGPYQFYRKLRSGPEAYVVPYARVHTSATEAYACPANWAARAGIGIDDN